MIGIDSASVTSWLALACTFVLGLIGQRLLARQNRSDRQLGERSSTLNELVALNGALKAEVGRLSDADAECQRRLASLEEKYRESRALLDEVLRDQRKGNP